MEIKTLADETKKDKEIKISLTERGGYGGTCGPPIGHPITVKFIGSAIYMARDTEANLHLVCDLSTGGFNMVKRFEVEDSIRSQEKCIGFIGGFQCDISFDYLPEWFQEPCGQRECELFLLLLTDDKQWIRSLVLHTHLIPFVNKIHYLSSKHLLIDFECAVFQNMPSVPLSKHKMCLFFQQFCRSNSYLARACEIFTRENANLLNAKLTSVESKNGREWSFTDLFTKHTYEYVPYLDNNPTIQWFWDREQEPCATSKPFWYDLKCYDEAPFTPGRKMIPCYYSPVFHSFRINKPPLPDVRGGLILLTKLIINLTQDWIALIKEDLCLMPDGITLVIVPDHNTAYHQQWIHHGTRELDGRVLWGHTNKSEWFLGGLAAPHSPPAKVDQFEETKKTKGGSSPLIVIVFEKEVQYVEKMGVVFRRIILDRVQWRSEYYNLKATRRWCVHYSQDLQCLKTWNQWKHYFVQLALWLQVPELDIHLQNIKEGNDRIYAAPLFVLFSKFILRLTFEKQTTRFQIIGGRFKNVTIGGAAWGDLQTHHTPLA